MNRSDNSTILRKTSFFWPIILFPSYERSQTIVYTGRGPGKDIKFSAGFARLTLTDSILRCRLIFPPLLILEVEFSDIIGVSRLEGKEGIVEIRFNKGRKGWLTRFGLSGDSTIPRDRALLNPGDEWETWYRELTERAGIRSASIQETA